MTAPCHGPAELEILAALPKGDPRREHLDECPRCQALLMTYSEFLHDRSAPEGSDLADAEVRLAHSFAKEQELRRASPPHDRVGVAKRPPPARPRSFRWLPISWPRPAFALAVAVMVAGLVYLGREWKHGDHGTDALRGESPSPRAGTPGPSRESTWLLSAERDPAGHPVLRWRSQPGADGYEIRLFGADLTDFARIGPQADTVLVLGPWVLPPSTPSTGEIGWQVIAQQHGRMVATSPPATVHLR